MTRNRERLAWLILLLSFTTCIGLVISTPLGVRQFIHTARVRQQAVLEPQRGTPGMQRGGRGAVEAVVAPIGNVYPETAVTTDETAQALLTLYAPGEEPAVAAAVQIYHDTAMTFITARSPRFDVSPLPHEVALEVTSGRMRITVNPAHGRPTVVNLRTPHMRATLDEGSYEIRVYPASSELAVRDGSAQIINDGEPSIFVGPSTIIAQASSASLRVLPGEPNLLENGDFDQPVEQGWERYERDREQEPGGTVQETTHEGRTAARFNRLGDGHDEVGIVQQLNYDMRDFASLTLHMNVLILYQSLPGCGSRGSECPVMVRIDYKDVDGTDRTWFHGFYAVEAAPGDILAEWDEQIPAGTWYTFDSGNLVELFERPPALIKEVTIYASGWSFDALVTEVELLAQE